MNRRIIIFNLFYYSITFLLFFQGIKNPSASLGWGIFIMIFWIASGMVLAFLCVKRIIPTTTSLDRIGVLIATPIILLIAIFLLVGSGLK